MPDLILLCIIFFSQQTELGKSVKRGYSCYPGNTYRYGRSMNIVEGGASNGNLYNNSVL